MITGRNVALVWFSSGDHRLIRGSSRASLSGYMSLGFCHQSGGIIITAGILNQLHAFSKNPECVDLSLLSIWLDLPWINVVVQIYWGNFFTLSLFLWIYFYSNNQIHLTLIKDYQILLLVVENILKDPLEQERALGKGSQLKRKDVSVK